MQGAAVAIEPPPVPAYHSMTRAKCVNPPIAGGTLCRADGPIHDEVAISNDLADAIPERPFAFSRRETRL